MTDAPSRPDQGVLPPAVAEFLDGERLESKLGQTMLLIAADQEARPHVAMLSVGEVYAPAGDRVHLTVYAHSKTSQAVRQSGRALLLVILDGSVVKVGLEVRAAGEPAADARTVLLVGTVAEVQVDRVGYADVVSGIVYELKDPPSVLGRWEAQVAAMRSLRS